MKQQLSTIIFFLFCSICHAQIDLQCNGRDMHSIYISDLQSGDIWRMDSVDTNPTNPVFVSSKPAGNNGGGICINANLDSLAGPETMYFINSGNPYYFWNGTGWTNTNHLSGNYSAVNPAGTSYYIFNLDGIGNALYRYDGTANGTLLLSNLNTFGCIWDLATDNTGNFYVAFCSQQQIIAFNPFGIAIDTFTTTGVPITGCGGMAILGNDLYISTITDLYKGIRTGNNIHFSLIKNIGLPVGDMATCPASANPLAISDHHLLTPAVYPNPFCNALNFTMNVNEIVELIIYDISSRKILNQSFTHSTSINTEQLTKGIYIYEISNKGGVIKKGKVVKG